MKVNPGEWCGAWSGTSQRSLKPRQKAQIRKGQDARGSLPGPAKVRRDPS